MLKPDNKSPTRLRNNDIHDTNAFKPVSKNVTEENSHFLENSISGHGVIAKEKSYKDSNIEEGFLSHNHVMLKKMQSHSKKATTRTPSPQLEKRGYASAPIRKYWQQYSNVRSGGSFDTISLRNEGSDEQTNVEVSPSRYEPDHTEVANVPFNSVNRYPPDDISTSDHAQKRMNENVVDGSHRATNSHRRSGSDGLHLNPSDRNYPYPRDDVPALDYLQKMKNDIRVERGYETPDPHKTSALNVLQPTLSYVSSKNCVPAAKNVYNGSLPQQRPAEHFKPLTSISSNFEGKSDGKGRYNLEYTKAVVNVQNESTRNGRNDFDSPSSGNHSTKGFMQSKSSTVINTEGTYEHDNLSSRSASRIIVKSKENDMVSCAGHSCLSNEDIKNGKLYDDEGLSVYQSQQLHVTTGPFILNVPENQTDLDNAKPKEDVYLHETPTGNHAFTTDDLNSPETEFYIFTTASQLATQEFNSRVEKAISPTKDAAIIKADKLLLNSQHTDLSIREDIDDMINVAPTSRYRHHYKDSVQASGFTDICESDHLHHENRRPSQEIQITNQKVQQHHDLWTSKNIKSDNLMDHRHFYEESNEIDHFQVENRHVIQRYPSFDSNIAITEDIIEILSVASSEYLQGHRTHSSIGSDSETNVVNSAQRSVIPILPPWQKDNDHIADTAPSSILSPQRQQGSSDGHEEKVKSVQNHHKSYSGHRDKVRRVGRPQPGALDTNESVYSKDLPSPLRNTLIRAMSPMLSGDSQEEDTVSEWSSRYDQSRGGFSESFHQQCCSFLACFDVTTLKEQLQTICGYKQE
jgi:hypothetical protein